MWEKLTRQIAKESGKTFGTKAQLVQLAELQRQWDECWRIINSHYPQHAKEAWIEHTAELAAAVKRGDLKSMDGYSRSDFESEFATKVQAGKDAMRAVTKESCPIIEDIAERFAKVAEDFAATQAKAEADTYARFGIQFPGPSSLITTLRKAADFARARIPRGEYANESPRVLVPYVDF